MGQQRAAIYCRISDSRDGDTAGVDRQLKDCRKLCKERGWVITGEYVDNSVSAMSRKPRPEYGRMMQAVTAGDVDVIVVWAVDRLYRRLTDLEQLVDQLGSTKVATVKSGQVDLSTADGRTMARILGSVAQGESEKKGERISRAYQERAEAGYFGGGLRRIGYNQDMSELNEVEADALRWAYRQIADGASLRSVIRGFEERGLRTSTGKPFVAFTVRKILLRPVNAGHAQYKGRIFEGASKAPAIVEPELWAQVKAILEDPSRQPHNGRPEVHLLSGILRCGVCGDVCRASLKSSSTGRARGVYRCYSKAHVSRAREPVNEWVSDVVVAWLTEERESVLEVIGQRTPVVDVTQDALEASRLRRELAALPDLLAAGQLDAVDYAAATGRLRDRLSAVESSLAKSSPVSPTAGLLREEDIGATWESWSVDNKRGVLKELIDHIRMDRVAKPGPRPTLDGIEIVWR